MFKVVTATLYKRLAFARGCAIHCRNPEPFVPSSYRLQCIIDRLRNPAAPDSCPGAPLPMRGYTDMLRVYHQQGMGTWLHTDTRLHASAASFWGWLFCGRLRDSVLTAPVGNYVPRRDCIAATVVSRASLQAAIYPSYSDENCSAFG